jgi:hypothetical protein
MHGNRCIVAAAALGLVMGTSHHYYHYCYYHYYHNGMLLPFHKHDYDSHHNSNCNKHDYDYLIFYFHDQLDNHYQLNRIHHCYHNQLLQTCDVY